MSRAQESAAKARIGNPTTSSYVMSSSSTHTVADTVFVERIKSRVKHWKSACKNTKKDSKNRKRVLDSTYIPYVSFDFVIFSVKKCFGFPFCRCSADFLEKNCNGK